MLYLPLTILPEVPSSPGAVHFKVINGPLETTAKSVIAAGGNICKSTLGLFESEEKLFESSRVFIENQKVVVFVDRLSICRTAVVPGVIVTHMEAFDWALCQSESVIIGYVAHLIL